MLNVLLTVAAVSFFALLYPMALTHLRTNTPPYNASLPVLIVLVAAFAFTYVVFVVERESGTDFLDQGLSASNVLTLALTGLAALYLGFLILVDRRIALLPFSMPYLPFTLMIAVDALTTFWSIVPSYTAYRVVELAVFYLATILIFDRNDIRRRIADLLALFIALWLAAATPVVAASFAKGIVFSAAKDNLMPAVCAALIFVVAFDAQAPRRAAYFLLGLAGFIIAGSAASTGALMAVAPAAMIASRHQTVRLLGLAAALVAVAVFIVLMVGLSSFPDLLQALSFVLQKPVEELADATGRGTFWPTFIEATRGHLFGSGFSAGDRFIQLLIPVDTLTAEMGQKELFLASAHNMFLSVWAGSGILGLACAVLVLATAFQWGMKLDLAGRRVVLSLLLFLILNGMTTPGIFNNWNVNVLAFVAALAYARVGVLARASALAAVARRDQSPDVSGLRPGRSGPILES